MCPSVQIMGGDPTMLAALTAALVGRGAPRVDLNCGCPAKSVTGKGAGSSLLRHPEHVHACLVRVNLLPPLPPPRRKTWNLSMRTIGSEEVETRGRKPNALFLVHVLSNNKALVVVCLTRTVISFPVSRASCTAWSPHNSTTL